MRYDLDVDIHETDWRAVRAFQVWQVADESGRIYSCSPSKAEIERQEVGPKMYVQFETTRGFEQLLESFKEVPEITVASLTVAVAGAQFEFSAGALALLNALLKAQQALAALEDAVQSPLTMAAGASAWEMSPRRSKATVTSAPKSTRSEP